MPSGGYEFECLFKKPKGKKITLALKLDLGAEFHHAVCG